MSDTKSNTGDKAPLMAADMTLRDYFAGQWLCGWRGDPNSHGTAAQAAEWAYEQADAMLAAREGKANG